MSSAFDVEQARPKNSQEGHRGPLKSSTPQHTGLGSRAERKMIVGSIIAEQSNQIDWERFHIEKEQPIAHHSPNSLRPFDNDENSAHHWWTRTGDVQVQGITSAGSNAALMLASRRGVARMQGDSNKLKEYARSVSDRAMGKGDQRKKPAFSPRQISQKMTRDSDFVDFWQGVSRTAHSTKESSDVLISTSVMGDVTPTGVISVWHFGPSQGRFPGAKNEVEESRQFARHILEEHSLTERSHSLSDVREPSITDASAGVEVVGVVAQLRASLLDYEMMGKTSVLEERPPGTPRTTTRREPAVENDHDLLIIRSSPDRRASWTQQNHEDVHTAVSFESGVTAGSAETITCQTARGEQTDLLLLGTPEPVHPQWRMARETRECRTHTTPIHTSAPHPLATAPTYQVATAATTALEESAAAAAGGPWPRRIPASKRSIAFGSVAEYDASRQPAKSHDFQSPRDPVQLLATGVGGRTMAPPNGPKILGTAAAELVDAGILSRAHFMLEYTAETNLLQLQHVDRVRTIQLWVGDSSAIEYLAVDLEDRIGVQKFQGMEQHHWRKAKNARPAASGPHDQPDTTLRLWMAQLEEQSQEGGVGVLGLGGDVRSFHFLPEGMLRQFVDVKRQLFAPMSKQRNSTSFSDGRCALLSGMVTNLEYVKGIVLRCPSNLSSNAAHMGAGFTSGPRLASEITIDLVFGHGAWSKQV